MSKAHIALYLAQLCLRFVVLRDNTITTYQPHSYFIHLPGLSCLFTQFRQSKHVSNTYLRPGEVVDKSVSNTDQYQPWLAQR